MQTAYIDEGTAANILDEANDTSNRHEWRNGQMSVWVDRPSGIYRVSIPRSPHRARVVTASVLGGAATPVYGVHHSVQDVEATSHESRTLRESWGID